MGAGLGTRSRRNFKSVAYLITPLVSHLFHYQENYRDAEPERVPRQLRGTLKKKGGDLQRPLRAAANRIDIPNQPFVLLLA